MDNNDENVDSGNSEDFVMTIESCTSKERHSEPEKYSFEVLTPDQIVQHMMDIIREVTTVIGIPGIIARILLNHFKWDKAKLTDLYYDVDRDRFFREAHVINPFNEPSNTTEPKLKKSGTEECEICFQFFPPDMMTGLNCDHKFCTSCWSKYLTTKIMEEELGQSIECAALGCNILVDDATVIKFVPDARVKLKYQHLITDSFVKCNRLLRWCPSADCAYAIKVMHVKSRPVVCKCGHIFCFECGEKWHDPVQCRLLKKFNAYLAVDQVIDSPSTELIVEVVKSLMPPAQITESGSSSLASSSKRKSSDTGSSPKKKTALQMDANEEYRRVTDLIIDLERQGVGDQAANLIGDLRNFRIHMYKKYFQFVKPS